MERVYEWLVLTFVYSVEGLLLVPFLFERVGKRLIVIMDEKPGFWWIPCSFLVCLLWAWPRVRLIYAMADQ